MLNIYLNCNAACFGRLFSEPLNPLNFYPINTFCKSGFLLLFCSAGVFYEGFHLFIGIVCQIKWLLKLSQIPEVIEVPNFSEDAQSYLQGIIDGFSIKDAREVKRIEMTTNHDVKAVEYFLKQRSSSHPEIAKVGTIRVY